MKLLDLPNRQPVPNPWAEGEKIPWNNPDFSKRMLREHLTQAHDHASRRFEIIDQHVNWIHDTLLGGRPGRILDVGCGPGLYTSRFARRGHVCTGIDFSPASIAYACETAQAEHLSCTYFHEDIRTANFGTGYDLAMLIFGEFNVFKPSDAKLILQKAHDALAEKGLLLLEPHPFQIVKSVGKLPSSWYSTKSGLFADRPHVYLQENFWDDDQNVATTRYFILDAETGAVTPYAASMQAYTEDGFRTLLEECGFQDITIYPSFGEQVANGDFLVIVARKGK